ncbi:hypothetical protein [Haliangium sp.]|uniref:hypothetical protein n=1 Tax=Haliangium sp. TaxID=2663208 RepID=UPI003D0CD79D
MSRPTARATTANGARFTAGLALAGLALTGLAPAAIALAGCAWGPGEPFAVLDAGIAAALEVPDGRDLGEGWQALASSYQIAIDELVFETGQVSLIDGGSGALAFDPADPPPGYSLCHNGHCHAQDGTLVPYEDIEAELGPTDRAVVLALPVGTLDVVAGDSRALACAPSCDLPLANIVRAELPLLRIRAAGRIRDGRSPARIDGELAWTLDLDLATEDAPALSSPLALPADRGHEPEVRLDLALTVTSRLFDDVAWADLDAGGAALALDTHEATRAALVDALGEQSLSAEVRR